MLSSLKSQAPTTKKSEKPGPTPKSYVVLFQSVVPAGPTSPPGLKLETLSSPAARPPSNESPCTIDQNTVKVVL